MGSTEQADNARTVAIMAAILLGGSHGPTQDVALTNADTLLRKAQRLVAVTRP